MIHHRILCRTLILMLIATMCMMGSVAAITTEHNGEIVSITGLQPNSIIWNASNFEGFNYGLNSQSSETLTIAPYALRGPNIDRIIDVGNLTYSSTSQIKQFEWNQFGNYLAMGFMAEPYFVGYINENENGTNFGGNTKILPDNLGTINLLSGGYISKVLIDSDDKITISTDNGLKLREGYVLNLQQVDLEGNKALIELTKNGKVVDTEVVYPGQNGITGDDIYTYDELDIGNEFDVPIISVRVDDVFRGATYINNALTIEGIFQISDNVTSVGAGNGYGAMEFTSVNSSSITMKNYNDSIILGRNSVQPIIGNITFQVADTDIISFFPSVNIINDPFDNSPMYTDYCCLWNLSEGYAFAFSQADWNGRKALFFLLKDGAIVDQEILTEESSTDIYSDFHYRYDINGTEIINATLKSVFRGIESNTTEIVEVNQRSEFSSSLLLINGSHTFKSENPAGIMWNLSDGYALTMKDISLSSDEAWFELSKDGVVVKDEILNGAFANTSSYTSGMGSISYSLDSVLQGAHENIVIIKNIQQYSDVDGNLLMSNDTHFYKTGDPVGMSWALPDGYVLSMKDIDIPNIPYTESEQVWFELSRDGIKLAEDVIWSGDRFTYVDGLESFDCVVTGIMHGTLADIVKINSVNLYSDSGVQLVQNDSHTYVTGNPSGDVWEPFEGYSLDPKDVSVGGNKVWLSLIKDGNIVKDEIIYAPEWFNYYNSTGALVFSTYVNTVFKGTDTNVITVMNTTQYSEINGSLMFQNLSKITLRAGISLISLPPVHNINKGTSYATIQAAIDDASPGDEIHVDSGTYYENVNVNKQLTLHGIDTGAGMPVVDAGGSESAITLAADGITLNGFTATGGDGSYSDAGIYLDSSSNSMLSGNTASNNTYGIVLSSSSNNNTLSGNTASDNTYGIWLYPSSNNTLSGNIASNNTYGIWLYSSSNNNTLSGNTASNNTYGILLEYSSNNNALISNTASNNQYGIVLSSSSNNNTLSGNTASNNSFFGIHLESSSNNNTLSGNTASNNSDAGILLASSSNNTLYHNNLVDNNNNAEDDSSNQWDSGAEGNHYSDYPGIDSNGDGIGDTAYPIPGGSSVDNYPLMVPWGENNSESTLPIINIVLPVNGTFVTTQAITVSGTASDDVAVANVTINGIPSTGTTNWSANITLTAGANTITAIATDTSGNIGTDNITITYTPLANTSTVNISDAQASVGDTITSSIYIDVNDPSGLSGATIRLTFDTSVVNVISVANTDFDMLVQNINNSAGLVTMVAAQTGSAGTRQGAIKFVDVTLIAVGNVSESSPLNLEVVTIKNNDGVNTPYQISNGTFVIGINGDFSGNYITDAWDITYLARHIVGIVGYETLSSGDISGDGVVDVWDVTYLARAIAGISGYVV